MNASSLLRLQMLEKMSELVDQSADMVSANQLQRVPTFFLSGSSLYFLDRILVRSRLLISGWILAYLARFSMKKRKYGVSGFLGKSG